MSESVSWIDTAISMGGVAGTVVTAVATIFLWRVTQLLARETSRMAQAMSQPQVVATLDPNRWSIRHFDLNVDNTGNATAYDIEIEFDPPLKNGEARTSLPDIPFGKISVLKPGHGLSSYLCEYALVEKMTYKVTVSWRRHPQKDERERIFYTLDMIDKLGVSRLGDDPFVQIANHVKKIEENWQPVAKGSKRIKIDAFSAVDRLHERRMSERQRRRWQQAHHPVDTSD